MRMIESQYIMLPIIDRLWVDHLYVMDALKTGIGLRGYGQKDPRVEYEKEAYEIFEDLKNNIADEAINVPSSIAAGSDGALWFTENGGQKIGRITTAGAISEYPLPNANANPDGMAEGPDGAVWFIEQAQVGRITTSGTIVSYPLASAATDSINGMVTGPDGAVWFTERVGNAIVRVAP
jgi:sugar lactone lactonase YvrE